MNSHSSSVVSVYLRVWAALLVLLAATVGAAFLNMGPFNAVVALMIAVTKAVLVILFFMHAKDSDRLIWVYAAAGVLWLLFLIGGTLADVLTR